MNMHDPNYNQRNLCTVKSVIFLVVIGGVLALLIILKLPFWVYILYVLVVIIAFAVTHWELVQDLKRFLSSHCTCSCNSGGSSNDEPAREVMTRTEPREGTTDEEEVVIDIPPTYKDAISSEPVPPSYIDASSKSAENLQNNANDCKGSVDNSTDNVDNSDNAN